MSGQSDYGLNIRAAVRGLWSGVLDIDQFWTTMRDTVNRGLTRAFNEGATECGIKPEEFTVEEQIILGTLIANELPHISDFAAFIMGNSKALGGKLATCMSRAAMWISRYQDVRQRASGLACGDRKKKWVMNPIKEHCPSCVKLDGKVKRNSYWMKQGVLPQNPPNPYLECGGWNCGCSLIDTDEPLSKGPLPSLP